MNLVCHKSLLQGTKLILLLFVLLTIPTITLAVQEPTHVANIVLETYPQTKKTDLITREKIAVMSILKLPITLKLDDTGLNAIAEEISIQIGKPVTISSLKDPNMSLHLDVKEVEVQDILRLFVSQQCEVTIDGVSFNEMNDIYSAFKKTADGQFSLRLSHSTLGDVATLIHYLTEEKLDLSIKEKQKGINITLEKTSIEELKKLLKQQLPLVDR